MSALFSHRLRGWALALAFLFVLPVADVGAQSQTSLPTGTAGRPYSTTLSGRGGTPPYTFAIENPTPYSLPEGLTLRSDGLISGTVTRIPFYGSSIFSVRITDSAGASYSEIYRIDVPLANVSVSPSVLPVARQGEPYSQTLVASGGIAPYNFVSLGDGCTATSTPSSGCSHFVSTDNPKHLPPGLRLERDGRITGTPTQPGDYSLILAVLDNGWTGPVGSGLWFETNGGIGLRGWRHVTLRVEPHPLTLTPDELPKGRVGAPYDVQFATSNGVAPYRYYADGLPPGLSMSEGGRLTGTPTAVGDSTIRVGSTESGARGARISKSMRLTIEKGASAPSLSLTAMAGVPVRVVLTDGATGGPFTAANVVSVSPANAGVATVSQLGAGADARFELTYTPDAYFSGVATVRYTLSSGAATSQPATITFNVVARPDPTRDAEVRGLLNAQADTARRFASSQIGNFQQRLARLHDANARDRYSNRLNLAIQPTCTHSDGSASVPGCDEQPGPAADRSLTPDENAHGPSHEPDAGKAAAGDFGLWSAGTIRRGDRAGRNGGAGADFESDGISLGADYRYTDALVIGAGLGYGRDDSDVGASGSRSHAKSLTLALYAGYAPDSIYFLDGVLGYQHLSFDLRRHVTATGGFVDGTRDGGQWFASLSAGADLRQGNWQFTPYTRVDVARATLDAYSEHGDPIYALAQDDLKVRTTTGSLGLRVDFKHKADWGMFTPELRLEYQHDFRGNGWATMRYADLPSGPYYATRLGDFDRNRLVFGLGGWFVYRRGWSFRVGYDSMMGDGGDRDRSLQLSIDKRY